MNSNLFTPTAIAANQHIHLFSCVLKGTAKLVRRCGFTKNNQTPWVSYINQAGKSCSHFLKKSLFAGYDINIKENWATVTNLSTGVQYSVKLDSFYCSCDRFKKTNAHVRCQHIDEVVKLYPYLEQVIAQYDLDSHIDKLAQIAPELKVGDRVIVNSWRKKTYRKLGKITAVSDIGAAVQIDGSLSWFFLDELTPQDMTESVDVALLQALY